jgi:phenylpyruvate tautomerase PptA (4-oxalocrotonate tautomerase family)
VPLVRIDLTPDTTPTQAEAISDAIHNAIVAVYGIPERDRFHVISTGNTLIAEDAGLGFERSSGLVMVQISTQRGRTVEAKQALYQRIAAALEGVGVDGSDVFIGYVENGPEDWSFGFGRAQYLTGELALPAGR